MYGNEIVKMYNGDIKPALFKFAAEQINDSEIHLKISDRYNNELEIETTGLFLYSDFLDTWLFLIDNQYYLKDNIIYLFPNIYWNLYKLKSEIINNDKRIKIKLNGNKIIFCNKNYYFDYNNKAIYGIYYNNELITISYSTNYFLKWMEIDRALRTKQIDKSNYQLTEKLKKYPIDELEYRMLLDCKDIAEINSIGLLKVDNDILAQMTTLCQYILMPESANENAVIDEELKQKIKEKLMKKD